ncbi:hypothetical protein JHW43_005621 [Diplocarpon mali]|nr:hypothetical protein JHW43_005621 [Diplocarpon mali]
MESNQENEPIAATIPNKNEKKTAKKRSEAFSYLVNSILKCTENAGEALGIDEAALTALEEAAEAFLVKEFQGARHALKDGSKKLRAEDIKAARLWREHGLGREAEPADGDQNTAGLLLREDRQILTFEDVADNGMQYRRKDKVRTDTSASLLIFLPKYTVAFELSILNFHRHEIARSIVMAATSNTSKTKEIAARAACSSAKTIASGQLRGAMKVDKNRDRRSSVPKRSAKDLLKTSKAVQSRVAKAKTETSAQDGQRTLEMHLSAKEMEMALVLAGHDGRKKVQQKDVDLFRKLRGAL